MIHRNQRMDDMGQGHIETDTNIPEGPVNEVDAVVPTDASFENKFGSVQNAYEEGFSASHGLRGETAETDGAVKHPDMGDESHPTGENNLIEEQNPGLADA